MNKSVRGVVLVQTSVGSHVEATSRETENKPERRRIQNRLNMELGVGSFTKTEYLE